MFNEKVIFAIDDGQDIHTVAKFTRLMDTKRACGYLQGSVKPCIGLWEGILEASYLMDSVDYKAFVQDSGYVDNQECVLIVAGDTRQPCCLADPLDISDRAANSAGPMCQVDFAAATEHGAYTYVIETGRYFIC